MNFKKLLKYFFGAIATLLLVLIVSYLIAPDYVKNKAVDLLFPTVTIEAKYQDKFVVEVPRVYELMYIACSLTPTFQADDNLIGNRTPEYYADVLANFDQFKDHPLVLLLEERLKGNAYSQLQPAMRMFSLNYKLSPANQLIEQEIFHVNPTLIALFKSKIFHFPSHLELIEDFANQSNFYQFYQKHQAFYAQLANQYERLCDFEQMWSWLEDHSEERYHSYRIIFSPLTGGFHNTIPGLKDRKTKQQQTWMFVAPPVNYNLDTLSPDAFEILSSKISREVFTEIDHNYINPISDNFTAEIERSIPDYTKWNQQKNGYSSSISTFNEYMTWSVFSLYAIDNFEPPLLDSILSIQEKFMVDRRKFIAFKAFNQQLIHLYQEERKEVEQAQLQSFYKPMLKWMETYEFRD